MPPSDSLEPLHAAASSERPRPVGGRLYVWLIAIGLLACALGVGWRSFEAVKARRALALVGAGKSEKARAVSPRHTHPQPVDFVPKATLEGTLAPLLEADLAFAVAGRVASIDAKVGDCVRAGQVLARLDPRNARLRLGVARAEARVAAAQADLAKDTNQRAQFLLERGGIAAAEGVRASQSSRLATAQREAASARVGLVSNELDEHSLRAPFDGCVTQAPKGPGGFVAPGSPQLHLVDLSKLRLTGTVSVKDAAIFALGARLSVESVGGSLEGRVTSIVPVVDPVVRRVQVVAEVENAARQLPVGGLFARARSVQPTPVAALRIPASALCPGSDSQVWIVEEGTLHRRSVDVGWEVDDQLIVRGGLRPSDVLLVAAPFDAKEGDRDVEGER